MIRGARIWGSRADCIAVSDDTVSALGDDVTIAPNTQVIDADGMTVLPGFQDAHVHVPFAGLNLLQIWLNDAHTRDEYVRIVAEYASAHPGDDWLTGGGWSMTAFPGGSPHKADLDAVVPDRPVFLMNRDVHGAWLNSKALEAAGITAATPDPVDGRIERDARTGEPTGALHEGAAYWVREQVVPSTSGAQWQAAIRTGQSHMHSLGITAWQDAWVTPATQAAYLALGDQLTGRVVGALWWNRHRGLEQIDDLLARREQAGTRFHPTTVKIMVDGVIENQTGALLEPYCCGHDTQGLTYVEPAVLDSAVAELDAHGFHVHMHAIGDRAVRMALDAVQAARTKNGRRDTRHQIAHVQVIHPDDIDRFAELGVAANCQMLWACRDEQMTELTLPVLGEPRSHWQYPFASLARSGAILAMGSDWPVSSANPLEQIEVGMTRLDPLDRDAEPLFPAERVDLGTAINAFTAGSAYVNGDDRAGRLEVGARADLTMIGADINDFTDGRGLGDVPITMTIASGRVVHEA